PSMRMRGNLAMRVGGASGVVGGHESFTRRPASLVAVPFESLLTTNFVYWITPAVSTSVALVSDAAKARAALTPLRRDLLERLREPGSASSLAGQLAVPRQKLAYHLRVLEEAGLVKLIEERQRRGFTERVLVACADTFVLDPTLVQGAGVRAGGVQDRH